MPIVRRSRKRDAILDLMRSTTCHPSADWVYQRMREQFPDVSLGTVYRNLIFFQQHGDIQSVGVVKGQERFDAVTTPHSHFVCNCCGSVLDLHDVQLDAGLTIYDSSFCPCCLLNRLRHHRNFFCLRCGGKCRHRKQ